MIVERTIVDALKAGLAPLPAVFAGIGPQSPGDQPAALPLVTVNRAGSQWANSFCGVDLELSIVAIQIDVYARSNEISRTLADQARAIIAGIDPAPTLQNEWTLYDDGARAFRVIQTWNATDYAPSLP